METAWAKLLAQLVVFKEESGGCTAVPQSWGKKMYNRFGIKEAPDWWSEELAGRHPLPVIKQPAFVRDGFEISFFKHIQAEFYTLVVRRLSVSPSAERPFPI